PAPIRKPLERIPDAGAVDRARAHTADRSGDIQERERIGIGIHCPRDAAKNAACQNDQPRAVAVHEIAFNRDQPCFEQDKYGERDLNRSASPVIFRVERIDEQRPSVLQVGDHRHAQNADQQLEPAIGVPDSDGDGLRRLCDRTHFSLLVSVRAHHRERGRAGICSSHTSSSLNGVFRPSACNYATRAAAAPRRRGYYFDISAGCCVAAAAATAMTLSRLMTRSAIRMVLMAERSWSLASISASSSSGTSSFTPIQNSSRLPTILSQGSVSSATANSVRRIRITMAAPEPQMIACVCCFGGSERAASASTTEWS